MASMTADITTTAGGATSIFAFLNRSLPSSNLAKGEAYLESTIYTIENTLDKMKDSVVLEEFESLRQEHDTLSNAGDNIRGVVEAPLSLGNIHNKASMVLKARDFAKKAKVLNSTTQRSSRKAASQRIKDKVVSIRCVQEAEDTTPVRRYMPVPDVGEPPSAFDTNCELGTCSSTQVPQLPIESWQPQGSGQLELDIPLEILEEHAIVPNSNSSSKQFHVPAHVPVEAASDSSDPFVDQDLSSLNSDTSGRG